MRLLPLRHLCYLHQWRRRRRWPPPQRMARWVMAFTADVDCEVTVERHR